MSVKVVTIVGARPQFIKAAAVSRAIRAQGADRIQEILVHTGQHHDANMSDVFFEELEIQPPAYNLGIAGGSHGAMTGRMLEAIEAVLLKETPDWVLIYGDTNSTLAGALAASKLNIPVAHVEAGLRSFNRRMPEEINRVVADRLSALLFCPTEAAVQNLQAEGCRVGVHIVGDVMYDVALHYRDKAREKSDALARFGLQPQAFVLATCHRQENTDDPARLSGICQGLARIAEKTPVLLPLHPRTRKALETHGLSAALGKVRCVEPLPFLDIVALEQAAKIIATDSGGVQKEAFFYRVPCLTLRDETEWVETVALGWNRLVGAKADPIVRGFEEAAAPESSPSVYGEGDAAARIVSFLASEV